MEYNYTYMEYNYTYMEYNYIFLGATHKLCTRRCNTQHRVRNDVW